VHERAFSAAAELPMRRTGGLLLLISLIAPANLPGQAPVLPGPAATNRIELAAQELQRIKNLVEIGLEARIRLEQAERNLIDARDAALLEETEYTPSSALSDQVVEDLIKAAQRRVEQAQARVELAKKLNAEGVAPQSDLTEREENLTSRQLDLDWAIARARFRAESAASAELSASIVYPPATTPLEPPSAFGNGMERYDGAGIFDEARDLKPLLVAFETEFNRTLPISADGETALHRSLGFDHRGRIDVAINPRNPQGIWLRRYLRSRNIPYYAFAHAVAGKATAAHIHIGPGSTQLHSSD
jgi:HEPN domain-containing protein